jgi:hypothetical protein
MKYLFTTIFIFSFAPLFLEASTLVEVKAGSERVNAIEGVLVLPAGASVEKIYTGDSAILIWIASPLWDEANRTVSFAGLSPGGFSGTAPLFTLELRAGEASVSGGRLTGYRNDGEGTAVELEYSLKEKETAVDNDPPELFEVSLARSSEAFEDSPFLTFAAQDKITGVARYEYRATWLFTPDPGETWRRIESPFAISKKEAFQRIHVRAVDNAGNFRMQSTVGPSRPITLLIGIIIIVCVALFITRSLPLPSSLYSSQR